MEIRQLAEQVLFGNTITEKLIVPDGFEDNMPGKAIGTPAQPGRPADLALYGGRIRDRIMFSNVRQMKNDEDRGLILHFFANHELLALELMALALLKFPDAPATFRRGLAKTLTDEQEHLRLYIDRMRSIGVVFGQIPVSDFFWRTIAPMASPLDYVTRLSLTLEQANLDYAAHYAQVYQNLGDAETARLLDKVRHDEISHVRHGLLWFRRWHPPDLTDWQAFQETLVEPLTPARAKGIGFNVHDRERAGLDPEFIAELEIFTRSKGRCPTLYWFNPACEAWAANPNVHYQPTKGVQALIGNLETLPMFLCAPDDIVLVQHQPRKRFLQHLHRAGYHIPEFTVFDPGQGLSDHPLRARKLGRLQPWGHSPESAGVLAPLRSCLPADSSAAKTSRWNNTWRRWYAKTWSAGLLRDFLCLTQRDRDRLCNAIDVGMECRSIAAVRDCIGRLRSEGIHDVIIKADVAAAGQHQFRLTGGANLSASQESRLENLLAHHGCVIVEPLLNKVCDFSVHLDIAGSGKARYLAWTRFLVDDRGRFIGAVPTEPVRQLDEDVRSFMFGHPNDPKWLRRLYIRLAAFLAERMPDYSGPLGIDALVYRCGEGLRLKPIVELNPRFTMGRVVMGLRRRIHPKTQSLWLLLRQQDVQVQGYADFSDFAARMEDLYPVRIQNHRIKSGVVFTTDPLEAEAVVSVLAVGDAVNAVRLVTGRDGESLGEPRMDANRR